MMNPSFPSTSFEKVPGPDQTLKFLRTSGSPISIGLWSSALVITTLVVVPLANTRIVALKTMRRLKAAAMTRFMIPPLPTKIRQCELRRGALFCSVQNFQYPHLILDDPLHPDARQRRQHEPPGSRLLSRDISLGILCFRHPREHNLGHP